MDGKQLVLANETETGSTFRCGTFAASTGHARHLATGNFDGKLQIWDPERLEIPVMSTKGHDLIINAIDGYGPIFQDSKTTELLTGGRDGRIKAWDLRTDLVPTSVILPADKTADVWSVAYASCGSGNRVFAAGYDSGDVKVFDQRSNTYVWDVNVGSGVCSLEFSSVGTSKLLVAGTLNGYHVIDLETGKVDSTKLDSTIWKVRHVPHGANYYMTASGDGVLCVHEHGSGPFVPVELKQTEHPIVSFDWNNGKNGLYAAVSFDQHVRVGIVNL